MRCSPQDSNFCKKSYAHSELGRIVLNIVSEDPQISENGEQLPHRTPALRYPTLDLAANATAHHLGLRKLPCLLDQGMHLKIRARL